MKQVYQNQGMSIKRIEVSGWSNALFGMRLPMNSEAQSDTNFGYDGELILGQKDKDLMIRLAKAGTDHSKVLRMIHVSALVKMPFSWWKHFSTYKVATVAISRSTMHKTVGGKPLTMDDFFFFQPESADKELIEKINAKQELLKLSSSPDEKRKYWEQIIDLLPTAYCQERLIDLNYQTLLSILGSRYQVEKLDKPWDFFCEAFMSECPHLKDIYEAVKDKRSMTTEEFTAMSKK